MQRQKIRQGKTASAEAEVIRARSASMHQRKSDGAHQVFWRDHDGRQRNRTFGKGREAKRRAMEFIKQIKGQGFAQVAVEQEIVQRYGVYFDELGHKWVAAKKAEGKDSAWLRVWVGILWGHILPRLPMKPVEELTELDILGVIGELYAERSQTTRNRYLSYMKIMCAWGVKHEVIAKNPLGNWQKSKEQRRRTRLSVEDVERIIAFAPPHLLWAIELAFNLGVRVGPSELLALKWHDVNWGDSSIRVFSGKTKTERTVYFSPAFEAKLREMQDKAKSPFLVEYRGEGIKSFRKSFKAACAAAGIEYTAVPYDLRHLYATTAITNGADIGAVSKQMGHATVKMTVDTYLHVMEQGKRKVASVLPSLRLPETGAQAGA